MKLTKKADLGVQAVPWATLSRLGGMGRTRCTYGVQLAQARGGAWGRGRAWGMGRRAELTPRAAPLRGSSGAFEGLA